MIGLILQMRKCRLRIQSNYFLRSYCQEVGDLGLELVSLGSRAHALFTTPICKNTCFTLTRCKGPQSRGVIKSFSVSLSLFPLTGQLSPSKPLFPCSCLLCLFLSYSLPFIPKSNTQCLFKYMPNFHPGVTVLGVQTLHSAEATRFLAQAPKGLFQSPKS